LFFKVLGVGEAPLLLFSIKKPTMQFKPTNKKRSRSSLFRLSAKIGFEQQNTKLTTPNKHNNKTKLASIYSKVVRMECCGKGLHQKWY
jgi:hypothetical protein